MGNKPNGIPAREPTELRGLRRGGKCSGMKKLILMGAALALASCGGGVSGVGEGDGGSDGARDSGRGGKDAGSSEERDGSDGSSGPADGRANDASCIAPEGTCIMCGGAWSCSAGSSGALATCPSGIKAGSPCINPQGLPFGNTCQVCTGGEEYHYICALGRYSVTTGSCSK
jgi:hypothetical protein